jgi:nicotinamide mononucleotide transporter
VTRWTVGWHLAAITGIAVAGALNGVVVAGDAAALLPYVDATIAWGSVLATWMLARKVIENWLYWIVLDGAAAVLYWTQGLYATAVLFVVYAVLAMRGYRGWARDASGHAVTV